MDLKTAPGKPLPSLKDERRYNSQAVSPQILGERSKQHDVGNQNTMAKVEISTTRPCAVIEPDRIIPQPAHKNESFMVQPRTDTWPYPDNTYNKYGIATTKPAADSHMPPRNISPRQTFQENMQRFMTQPRLDLLKGNDQAAIMQSDKTVTSLKNVRVNPPMDPKYCDVPYVVNPLQSDHRARMIRNGDLYTTGIPQGVIPSQPHWSSAPVQVNPYTAYGPSELNRYQEYTTCTIPRTSVVSHQTRVPPEEPTAYSESYFRGGDVRYEPYPTSKDKYQRTRYDYVNTYSTPCPPYYHPPKYDIPKNLSLPTYVGYNHTSYKYADPRMVDYSPEPYSRQQTQFPNYPDPVQAKYSVSNGNVQNKICSYPIDNNQLANTKVPYNTNRIYSEYESNRFKVPIPEAPYLSSEMQHYQIKPQVPIHNHINSDNMKPPPYAYYYRNEGPMMRNIGHSYPPRFRNYDPSQFGCHNPLAKIPIQFSPNVISPSGSNTSNDSMLTHSTSQEDYGYVSQCSTASGKSVDSTYPYPNDIYRKSDRLYFNSNMQSTINRNLDVKEKPVTKTLKDKNLDVRQFLQMWDEEFEEVASIHKAPTLENDRSNGNSKQEQLYVLGMVNVSSEELQKYEHIQKVSKLPENIKGYDNVELLRQFDAVFGPKESPSNQTQNHKKPKVLQLPMPERPISPLDVESKISQSVIHKEVGCNFEIKPCSPSKLDISQPQIPMSVMNERRIERVLNCQDTIIKSIADLEMKKSVDKRKLVQNIEDAPSTKIKRVSDCKIVNSIKPEYISKEYQNISSVSFDSLPRLDTELDLNFQEVNQQFLNSQINCHPIEKKCSAKVDMLPSNNTNIESAKSPAADLQHYNETLPKDTHKTKSVLLSNPLPRTDSVIKKTLPVLKECLPNQSPNNNLSNQPSNEPFDHESLLYNFNEFHSPSINQVDNDLTPMNLTSDSANYLSECVNEISKSGEEKPVPKCESISDSISINVAINLSIHSNNPDVYNSNGIQSTQSTNSLELSSERHLKENSSLEPYFNEVSCTITPCGDTINEINLPALESGPKNDNAITISTHHEIDFGSIISSNDMMNHKQIDVASVENKCTLLNDTEPISDMHQLVFESSETPPCEDVKYSQNKYADKHLLKTDPVESISASYLYLLNTECSFTRIHTNENSFESSERSSFSGVCINHSDISSDHEIVEKTYQQSAAHLDHTDQNTVSIMSSQKKRHLKTPRSVECIFDSISGKIILKTGKKISSQKARNSEISKEVAHHETLNLSLSSKSLGLKESVINEEHSFNENVSSREISNLNTNWNNTVKISEKHEAYFNIGQGLKTPKAASISISLPNIKTLLEKNALTEGDNRETEEEKDICKQHYGEISMNTPETVLAKPNICQQSFEMSHRNRDNIDQTIDRQVTDFETQDSLCFDIRQSTVITSSHESSALETNDEINPDLKSATVDKDMTLDMSVYDDSNDKNTINANAKGFPDLPKIKSVTDERAQPHDSFSQKTPGYQIKITKGMIMESKKSNQTLQNFKPKQAIKKIKLKAKKIKGLGNDKKSNSIIIRKEVGHLKLKLSLRGVKRTSNFRSKKSRKKKYYIVNENTLQEETESLGNREKASGYETNEKCSEISNDTKHIYQSLKTEQTTESFIPSGSVTSEAPQSQQLIYETAYMNKINIKDGESTHLINIGTVVEGAKNIFSTNENEVPQDLTPERNCQQMREETAEISSSKSITKISPSKEELIHQNNTYTSLHIPSNTFTESTGYIVDNNGETCDTKSSIKEDSDQTQSDPKNIDMSMIGDKLKSSFESLKLSQSDNVKNRISPQEILSEIISENSIEIIKNSLQGDSLEKNNQFDFQSINQTVKFNDFCRHDEINTVKLQASNEIAEGVKNILENSQKFIDNSSNQCSSDNLINKRTKENPLTQYISTIKREINETTSSVLEELTNATIEQMQIQKSQDQGETRTRNIEINSVHCLQDIANDTGLKDLVENKTWKSAIIRPTNAQDFYNSKEPIETFNVEIKCESLKQPLEQLSPDLSKVEINSVNILPNNIATNNKERVILNNQDNEGKSVLVEIESSEMDGEDKMIELKKSDPWQEETNNGNIIDAVTSFYNIKLEAKCEAADNAFEKTSINCTSDEINTEFACIKNTTISSIENITQRCKDREEHYSAIIESLSVESLKKEEPEQHDECLSYHPKIETNNDNNKKSCTMDSSVSVTIDKKEPTKLKDPWQENSLTETQNCRDDKYFPPIKINAENHSPLADSFKNYTTKSCSTSRVIFPQGELKFSNTMKHENTCELKSDELQEYTYDCFLDTVSKGDPEKYKDMTAISEDGKKIYCEKLATLPCQILNTESEIPQILKHGQEEFFKNDDSTSLDRLLLLPITNIERNDSSKTEIESNVIKPRATSESYKDDPITQSGEETDQTTLNTKYGSLDMSLHDCEPFFSSNEGNVEKIQSLTKDDRNKQLFSDCNQTENVKDTHSSSGKDQQTEDAFTKSPTDHNMLKPVSQNEICVTTNNQNDTTKPFTENNDVNEVGPSIDNFSKTNRSYLTTDNNQYLIKHNYFKTDAIRSSEDLFEGNHPNQNKILTDKENCNTFDKVVISTQSEGQPTEGSFAENDCALTDRSLLHPCNSRTVLACFSENRDTENNNLLQNNHDSGKHEANVLVENYSITPVSSNNEGKLDSKSKYSNIYIKCSLDARSEPEDYVLYENSLARLVHDYPSPIETTENKEFSNACNQPQNEKNEAENNCNILNTEKLQKNEKREDWNESLDAEGLSSSKIKVRSEGSTLLADHDIFSQDTTEINSECLSSKGLVHNYKSPLYDFASDNIDHQTVANKLYNELWSSFIHEEIFDQNFQTVSHETNTNCSNDAKAETIDLGNYKEYFPKNLSKVIINETMDEMDSCDSEHLPQDVPIKTIDEHDSNIKKAEEQPSNNIPINELSEVSPLSLKYENCAHNSDHTSSKTLCVSCFENPDRKDFESTLHKENFDKSTFCQSRSKDKESITNENENYRPTQHHNKSQNFCEIDNEESGLKERLSHFPDTNNKSKINDQENTYGYFLPHLLNENMNDIEDGILHTPNSKIQSTEMSKHLRNKVKRSIEDNKRSFSPPKQVEGFRINSKVLSVLDGTILDGHKDNIVALRQDEQGVGNTQQYSKIIDGEQPILHSKINAPDYLPVGNIITNAECVENNNGIAIQKDSLNRHNDFVIKTKSNSENDYVVLTCDTNNIESTNLKFDEKDHDSYGDTNFEITNFVASDFEPEEILSMNTISKEIGLESEYIVTDALEINESEDTIITDGLCFLYHDDSEVVLSSESTGCTSGIAEQSNNQMLNETCESVHISSDMWIDDIACVETVVTEGSNMDNADLFDLCGSSKEFPSNLHRLENFENSDTSGEENENCEFMNKTLDIESSERILNHVRNNCEIGQNCSETSENYVNIFSENTKIYSKPKIKTASGSVFELSTHHNNGQSRLRCKFTEKSHYSSNIRNCSFGNNLGTVKPLITKAAQKYIPPLNVSPDDLKVRLKLPTEMLKRLREFKKQKIRSIAEPCSVIEHNNFDSINKRNKPKFEDVLKNIDQFQCKILTHTKTKKKRHHLQSVDLNKTKSCSGKGEKIDTFKDTDSEQSFERYKRSPDLTGCKWQPWVFLEKDVMIEKMVLGMKTSALYCSKKNQILFSENIKSRRKSVPTIFKSKNREPLKYPSVYSRSLSRS